MQNLLIFEEMKTIMATEYFEGDPVAPAVPQLGNGS